MCWVAYNFHKQVRFFLMVLKVCIIVNYVVRWFHTDSAVCTYDMVLLKYFLYLKHLYHVCLVRCLCNLFFNDFKILFWDFLIFVKEQCSHCLEVKRVSFYHLVCYEDTLSAVIVQITTHVLDHYS